MQTAAQVIHRITKERTGTAYSNELIIEAMQEYARQAASKAWNEAIKSWNKSQYVDHSLFYTEQDKQEFLKTI